MNIKELSEYCESTDRHIIVHRSVLCGLVSDFSGVGV